MDLRESKESGLSTSKKALLVILIALSVGGIGFLLQSRLSPWWFLMAMLGIAVAAQIIVWVTERRKRRRNRGNT
jgi:Flp pilus assembly protein TadB